MLSSVTLCTASFAAFWLDPTISTQRTAFFKIKNSVQRALRCFVKKLSWFWGPDEWGDQLNGKTHGNVTCAMTLMIPIRSDHGIMHVSVLSSTETKESRIWKKRWALRSSIRKESIQNHKIVKQFGFLQTYILFSSGYIFVESHFCLVLD